MPQNKKIPRTRDFLFSPKTTKIHFFSTLHPHSCVIFATATAVAFVLLRNSRFNFHSVKQRLLRNRPGSDAATSRDFLHESLQRAFTCANQLHWTAQYPPIMFILIHSFRLTTKIYLYTQPLVLRDYYLSGYVCGQLRRYHRCINHVKYLWVGRDITVPTCLQWAVKNSKKLIVWING